MKRLVVVISAVSLGCVSVLAAVPASAARAHEYGSDQLALSYEVPITNPGDGHSYPSVLLVSGARLDSQMPDGSGVSAPDGQLYLTLQMSSGPVQHNFGDPSYGYFFSNMTPLPASAFRCLSDKGKKFPMTRSNPTDETVNVNSDTEDGLVAATYACLVPDNFRAGTVEIGPSSTIGAEYQNMNQATPTVVHVGGPINVPVQFPAQLTVVGQPNPSGDSSSSNVASSSPGQSVPWIAVLLLGGVGATVFIVRRRKVGTSLPDGQVTTSATAPPPPPPPAQDDSAEHGAVEQRPAPTPVAAVPPAPPVPTPTGSWLRILVLGPLAFEPFLAGLSDPARSILCYLAFHNDRPRTIGEIQLALWPMATKDVSPRTLQNYIAEARKAVGKEVFPEANRGSGYQLSGFSTDVDDMDELIELAKEADDERSLQLRLEALALVRELPFATEISTFFEWVRSEGLESQLIRKVIELAEGVSRDCQIAGDMVAAKSALRVALRVAPTSVELWEQLGDLTAQLGNRSDLERLWREAAGNLSDGEVALLREKVSG